MRASSSSCIYLFRVEPLKRGSFALLFTRRNWFFCFNYLQITNFWKSLVQSQQNTSQTSLQGTSTSLSGKSGLWNRAVNAVLTKKVKKVSSDKETVRVHFMHVHDVEIPLEDAERLSAILPRYQFRIANFEEDNQKMVKPGEFLRKFAKPSPSWFVSRKKSLG